MIRIFKWLVSFLWDFLQEKKKNKGGGSFRKWLLIAETLEYLVIFDPVFYRLGLVTLPFVMLLFQIFQKGCPNQSPASPTLTSTATLSTELNEAQITGVSQLETLKKKKKDGPSVIVTYLKIQYLVSLAVFP